MKDWFANDELFSTELRTGHEWARRVVDRFQAEGLDARLTPMEFRNNIDDRQRFADEGDIRVATMRSSVLVESKSRRLRFTEVPSTYPFSTALVDTVSGWSQKVEKPVAIVLVSQMTGAMLAISVRRTQPWTIKRTHDRVRNIDDSWYQVARNRLEPVANLIEWLKQRKPAS